jgi:hypothetical protein
LAGFGRNGAGKRRIRSKQVPTQRAAQENERKQRYDALNRADLTDAGVCWDQRWIFVGFQRTKRREREPTKHQMQSTLALRPPIQGSTCVRR